MNSSMGAVAEWLKIITYPIPTTTENNESSNTTIEVQSNEPPLPHERKQVIHLKKQDF